MSRVPAQLAADITASSWRRFVPAASVLLAALLMALPLPLAWASVPQLGLLLLVFWANVQPRLLPPWAALLLGAFTDLLFGLPLGIWTVIYPAMVVAVRLLDVRLAGSRSFLTDWALALLLVAVAMFLVAQFLRFVGQTPALLPLAGQGILTVLAYPAVAAVGARIQARLADFGG